MGRTQSSESKSAPAPDACANCGLALETHREAKTDVRLKQMLAVCETFEQAKCGTCSEPVGVPMVGMNNGYFGPWFCESHCPGQLWAHDFTSWPECVKCGVDRVEYLEDLLKSKGIAYDDEWHDSPDDRPPED